MTPHGPRREDDPATTFRAIWPVIDAAQPLEALIRTAERDLPSLLRRARAKLTGPGQYSIADSTKVAGSGRVSPLVLLFTAPAASVATTWPPGAPISESPEMETQRRPSDVVDQAVVSRLLDGQKITHSTRAEKQEAMRLWVAQGKPQRSLCRIHGWREGDRYSPTGQQKTSA